MAKKDNIPVHLSNEMKQFFKKTIDNYNLEDHHLILLTRACEAFDMADKARKQIAEDGLTTTDRYGSIKPHPCVDIELKSKNNGRLLLRELGLDLESGSEPNRAPRLY